MSSVACTNTQPRGGSPDRARETARGNPIVDIRDLHKSYGSVQAVRGISFSIPDRAIFGLLGPNGAGKTTTIEMIEGIRIPDSGTIRVAGLDPFRDGIRVRQIVGAQLQITSLSDKLRVWEAFDLFASFYAHPMPLNELLDLMGLQQRRDAFFQNLSGGEKQRVALGLALVGSPRMLFLDEPTAGLDPQIRRELHTLILRLRDQGRSILMTTHYIEEAEKLCDLVGIMDEGRLHAIGHPKQLIQELGDDERLDVMMKQPVQSGVLAGLAGVSDVHTADGRYILRGPSGSKMLASVAVYAHGVQNEVIEARISRTTLEDVYLKMTGRRIDHEIDSEDDLDSHKAVVSN